MNDTKDSSIVSNEHYELLQMMQPKRTVPRSRLPEDLSPASMEATEMSVREFNAELLQRVGDFRKRNLELASIESNLKQELAQLAKRSSDRERAITMEMSREIQALKNAATDQRLTYEQANETWHQKLAKLTDENWALGIEITTVRGEIENHRTEVASLKAELEKQAELALEKESELERQIKESSDLVCELQSGFEALRLEYSKMDQCYRDANALNLQLRAQLQAQHAENEQAKAEFEARLRESFASDTRALAMDNAKLRDLLSQRDTRHDEERVALQTWREQLAYLEQHLQGFSEHLKRGRTDLVRTAKKIDEEIQFAVAQPFTDYLEMANLEVTQLQSQMASASSMSPLRAKLETRLAQATSHRDSIRSILENSDSELKAHAVSLKALLKNLEGLR